MKKIATLLLAVVVFCCGCSSTTMNKTVDKSLCSQPGSYFPENEERYILVDMSYQQIGDEVYLCKVFADKYMLTMYLWVEQSVGYKGYGSMTQIFYEDGSPMIYDDDSLVEE